MTRNIIAEFSCSLDNNGEFKKYEVVTGSSFTDAYNEELDSASLLLAHVKNEDRLIDIKPYDFVRVYDEASWDGTKYTFDHVYLVDNFFEREDNISDRIFSYTINVMSETKLLEKIQCPSLTITHGVNEDGSDNKKTIFEKICEYMELYVPKIKKEYLDGSVRKWRYEPIIENPGNVVPGQIEFLRNETTESFSIENATDTSTYTFEISRSNWENTEVDLDSIVITSSNQYLVDNPEFDKTYNPSTGTIEFGIKSLRNMRGVINFDITISVMVRNGEYIPQHYEPKQGYEDFYNKFNFKTADLGSSYFTLRQLLTMLMQQVGCIPSVNDLKLGYLDFNDVAETFDVDETINYVQKSLASDSFSNTLVNNSGNVLDSGNEVISETLGFRDRNNVLLKQQENLYLETKFPIYKINEFKINCLLEGSFLDSYFQIATDGISVPVVINDNFNTVTTKSRNVLNIKLQDYSAGESRLEYCDANLTFHITTFSKENNVLIKKESISVPQTLSHYEIEVGNINELLDFNQNFTEEYDFFAVEVTGSIKLYGSGYIVEKDVIMSEFSSGSSLSGPAMVSIDITPLIKEQQERSLLLTNFKEMEEAKSIEDLSKYIYGTLGYTIGSNRIEGFSNQYSQIQGKIFVWTENYTYIENIYKWLEKYYFKPKIREILKKETGISILNDNAVSLELFNPTDFIKFTQFTFDIKYQPLNSFNMSFVKSYGDIDFPIKQLNTSESGLTDFDRLSINQQETIDRIGNPTLSISQRISPEQFGTKLHALPAIYNRDNDEHVIFKRTYTVGNFKYDVNYIGSKNSILKNYFTSIRTKYRAYNYVDYNQSTLRKENDTIFVRLDENYYNGDDKIYFEKGKKTGAFIRGCIDNYDFEPLKYACEKSKNKNEEDEVIKNEISVISNGNSFAVIYEQPDNVSAGPYIASARYNTYYDDATEEDKLGGVPQKWQEWEQEEYNISHRVFYTSNLNFYDKNNGIIFYEDDDEAIEQVEMAAKSPILPIGAQQIKENANVFSICDDNKGNSFKKTFYKDYSERLNHTVQFIYYTNNENIKWTENFIANNGFIMNEKQKELHGANAIYYTNSMELDKNLHSVPVGDEPIEGYNPINYYDEYEGIPAVIRVIWSGHDMVKVCHKDNNDNVEDIIVFRRPNEEDLYTDFHVTLNDTKSDYVMSVRNGVLYRSGRVKTNNMNREVENL